MFGSISKNKLPSALVFASALLMVSCGGSSSKTSSSSGYSSAASSSLSSIYSAATESSFSSAIKSTSSSSIFSSASSSFAMSKLCDLQEYVPKEELAIQRDAMTQSAFCLHLLEQSSCPTKKLLLIDCLSLSESFSKESATERVEFLSEKDLLNL